MANILTQMFQQHQQQNSNPTMAQLSQFANSNPLAQKLRAMGSPKNAYDYLMNNNVTIPGPNGQQMNIQQFCDQNGLDRSLFQ